MFIGPCPTVFLKPGALQDTVGLVKHYSVSMNLFFFKFNIGFPLVLLEAQICTKKPVQIYAQGFAIHKALVHVRV